MIDLDAQLFQQLYNAWGGRLTGVALFLSAIGGGWAMLGLVPMLASARFRRVAVSLGLTVGTSALVVVALKQAFARPRPCVSLAGVHALCSAPTDPSFPSGHACGTFTFATFLLTLLWAREPPFVLEKAQGRRLLTVGLLALAAAIAWSRVYLGVHFPGDVVSGALLGAAAGAAGARLYLRRAAVLA
jgi:undecaprenyl-diphosphatase